MDFGNYYHSFNNNCLDSPESNIIIVVIYLFASEHIHQHSHEQRAEDDKFYLVAHMAVSSSPPCDSQLVRQLITSHLKVLPAIDEEQRGSKRREKGERADVYGISFQFSVHQTRHKFRIKFSCLQHLKVYFSK